MAAARAAPRTAARPRRRTASRPRSRPARRPAAKIRWDRVARTTLLIVLVVVLFSFLGPATKYFRSWQLARETRGEVRQLRTDNARLTQEAKLLQNPGQIELRARQMGMARPGERVYVVRGLPKSP
jgi:cell division protein FtsB